MFVQKMQSNISLLNKPFIILHLRKICAINQLSVKSVATLKTSHVKNKLGSIGSNAKMFKIERVFSAACLPLIPISYFVHNQTMDVILIAAITINAHWGGLSLVNDYVREIIVGKRLAKIAPKFVYLVTAILLASLLHFQMYDVGLTRAFEMVFSL